MEGKERTGSLEEERRRMLGISFGRRASLVAEVEGLRRRRTEEGGRQRVREERVVDWKQIGQTRMMHLRWLVLVLLLVLLLLLLLLIRRHLVLFLRLQAIRSFLLLRVPGQRSDGAATAESCLLLFQQC